MGARTATRSESQLGESWASDVELGRRGLVIVVRGPVDGSGRLDSVVDDTDRHSRAFRGILALEQLLASADGKSILLFVDTEPAEGSLMQEYSARTCMCDLVAPFCDAISARNVSPCVARVLSSANPADLPSMADIKDMESEGR